MGFRQAVEETLNGKIFSHAALLLTAAAFVYVFSYSTSPRYDFLGGDSSIFQSVGKIWAEGFLPYVDAFEHKGPLLFLINAVGYAIAPRVGLLVPQIICLYIVLLFTWRAMSLYSSSAWRIFFMALAIIFYAAHYQEGNHVEEYSAAFVAVAAYFFMRGLKTNEFPPIIGLVHGIGFGACAMIRLSDAAQICCQIFLLAIFLLRDGEKKLLRKIFLNFCAGVAVMILPFVVYFAAHGALYELIYGTLLFNMKYTASELHQLPLASYVMFFGVNFMPLFVLAVTAIFARGRLAWSGFFCAAAMLVMLMNFRLFRHYCLMIFPMMPLLFAVLKEFLSAVKNWFLREKNFLQKIFHVVIVLPLVALFVLYEGVCFAAYVVPMTMYRSIDGVAEIQKQDLCGQLFLLPRKFVVDYDYSGDEKFSTVEDLARLIPDSERTSVVTWGFYCTTPHWVLRTGIKSRERLFFLNGTFMGLDPNFRREWFGNVRKNLPRWILCGYDLENGEPVDGELEQLLAEKYSPVGETFIFPQVMKLFRLKE